MASRKEKKEALRRERLEREQAAAAAAQRKRFLGLAAGGGLVVAALAALVIVLFAGGGDGGDAADFTAENAGGTSAVQYPDNPSPIPPAGGDLELRAAARAADCRLEDPPNEGAEHVPEGTDVQYRADPPTSGSHFPTPAEDGAYTEPLVTENAVHALEHGRIYIQFQPTLDQRRIGQLKALFDEDSFHMLLAPNPDLPVELAATAWDHALLCERMNDQSFDAIRAFKDTYRDQGPEFVP